MSKYLNVTVHDIGKMVECSNFSNFSNTHKGKLIACLYGDYPYVIHDSDCSAIPTVFQYARICIKDDFLFTTAVLDIGEKAGYTLSVDHTNVIIKTSVDDTGNKKIRFEVRKDLSEELTKLNSKINKLKNLVTYYQNLLCNLHMTKE